MKTIQNLHGITKIIVSDKYLILSCNFWKELFSCLGILLDHRSSYHPQFDVKIDIINKFLEGYVHCCAFDKLA